jgi:MFS family permease
VVCGLVACAFFMFTLHDVKAFSMSTKPVVFTQGEIYNRCPKDVFILKLLLLFNVVLTIFISLSSAYFELLHNADWTPAHTKLSAVLTLAITIDIMKPATIGFIMPGLLAEYGLTKTQGAVLPTVAISGTVIGSIIWGFMADRVGRKYSILLSTILFIATSICGAMPSFPTNIFMCWLMGVSVGVSLTLHYLPLTVHLIPHCSHLLLHLYLYLRECILSSLNLLPLFLFFPSILPLPSSVLSSSSFLYTFFFPLFPLSFYTLHSLLLFVPLFLSLFFPLIPPSPSIPPGGLIPVAVSLLSEVVPSRVRSKVLIAM